MDQTKIVKRIIGMTDEARTMEDLYGILAAMTHAIGGMVCHFPQDERSQVLIQLTQSLGFGLQLTSKGIGEPSDIEMVVGNKK